MRKLNHVRFHPSVQRVAGAYSRTSRFSPRHLRHVIPSIFSFSDVCTPRHGWRCALSRLLHNVTRAQCVRQTVFACVDVNVLAAVGAHSRNCCIIYVTRAYVHITRVRVLGFA